MMHFERFAEALDYPTADLPRIVERCLAETAGLDAEVPLKRFSDYVGSRTTWELEEQYTGTFDLNPDCCLYAGHHLLGDDDRRGVLMVRLGGHYRKHGFSAAPELPDHIGVMLRFVAGRPADPDTFELISECLVPALDALTHQLESRKSPWGDLTRAISLALQQRTDPALVADGAVVERHL